MTFVFSSSLKISVFYSLKGKYLQKIFKQKERRQSAF